MRRRITVLVAATTSAVILAFVIPLTLLVRTLAEDRALAGGRQQAQAAAALVASVPGPDRLSAALDLDGGEAAPTTSVLLPTGLVVGAADDGMADDPDVVRARSESRSFTTRRTDRVVVLVAVASTSGTSVVRTTVTEAQLRQGVASAWTAIVGLGLGLFGLAVLVARRLGERVSTPVVEVARVAHRLRAGDVTARAPTTGPPETVELGSALNQLADRIGDLVTAEREAAADLSHRLRTPVTALRLDAELVTDPEIGPRLRDHVDSLHQAIDAVIAEARRPVRTALPGRSDVREVVRDRVAFWTPLADDQRRRLSTRLGSAALPVPVAAEDVAELVDVLVDNVFAHTPEGVDLDVTGRRREDGRVELVVSDDGPGMPPGSDERGASGSGSSGLGLNIARRIAESAGGQLTVGSSPTGGVRVCVTLPSG